MAREPLLLLCVHIPTRTSFHLPRLFPPHSYLLNEIQKQVFISSTCRFTAFHFRVTLAFSPHAVQTMQVKNIFRQKSKKKTNLAALPTFRPNDKMQGQGQVPRFYSYPVLHLKNVITDLAKNGTALHFRPDRLTDCFSFIFLTVFSFVFEKIFTIQILSNQTSRNGNRGRINTYPFNQIQIKLIDISIFQLLLNDINTHLCFSGEIFHSR